MCPAHNRRGIAGDATELKTVYSRMCSAANRKPSRPGKPLPVSQTADLSAAVRTREAPADLPRSAARRDRPCLPVLTINAIL